MYRNCPYFRTPLKCALITLKLTKQVYHNVMPPKDATSEDFYQTAYLTTNSSKLKWLTLARFLRKSLKECLLCCCLFHGYSGTFAEYSSLVFILGFGQQVKLHGPITFADMPYFWWVLYISVLRKHLFVQVFSLLFISHHQSANYVWLRYPSSRLRNQTRFANVNVLENNVWLLLLHEFNGLGFKHPPRDLANVNAWKTMFDPYIERT